MKPNEIEIKFFAHRIDQANQVLVFLFRAIHIALLINKPGDLRIRSKLGAHLLSPQSCGPNKVRPPVIVRINFIFLPLIHGGSANKIMYSPDGGDAAFDANAKIDTAQMSKSRFM